MENSNKVKMEDRKAELRNELDKAMKAPKTRILEYYNRIKILKIRSSVKRRNCFMLMISLFYV